MDNPSQNVNSPEHRSGFVVIVALVFLGIAIVFLGLWTQRFTEQNRQLRRYRDAAQARWLAESGLRRAVALRAGNPEYPGELWTISPETLSQRHGGRVEIRVEQVPDDANAVRISATAHYPDDPIQRVCHTESMTFNTSYGMNRCLSENTMVSP